MRYLRSAVDWLLSKILAIQEAHHEAARNIMLRLLFALLTWKFMGDTWDSGSLTLWSPESRSAAIATFFGRDFVGWLFIAASVALAPFMLSELCWWVRRRRRLYAKLAMAALGGSGLLYLALVSIARYTELAIIKQVYARNGIECLAMMLLIGTLLNAQLRAERGLDEFVNESNRVPLE